MHLRKSKQIITKLFAQPVDIKSSLAPVWSTWALFYLKKRFERDIEIIFVSVDANPTKVVPKFLKNNELENFQTYIDKKLNLTKELEVKVMPTTLIITTGPYELSRVEGYIDWLNKELLSELEKLL